MPEYVILTSDFKKDLEPKCICRYCGEKFFYKLSLEYHLEFKHGQKP